MQNGKHEFTYPRNIYPFKSNWIKVGGNRIHFLDEGTGDAILFCHPPVTSSFMYRHMISELSRHFRCIALDFPGFGLSEPFSGGNLSFDVLSEIVEQLLDRLQLGSVFLLMQECGGHAAMKTFLKHPGKLKGIIITDTIVFPVSDYPRIRKTLSIINGVAFNFINSKFNFLIRAMTRFGIRKRKLTSEERIVYKRMFRTRSIRQTSIYLLHQLVIEENLLSQIQEALETIFNKIPTLIIYGEMDPLTAMKVPQRIHSMMPNSELYFVRGEGHFPHEGAPDEMNVIIRNWLHGKLTV